MQPEVSSCKLFVPCNQIQIQKVWCIRKSWSIRKTVVYHSYPILLTMKKTLAVVQDYVVFFDSGVCEGSVFCVNGGVGVAHTPAYVQSTEDRGDLLLQHGPYQAAMVKDLEIPR